MGRLIDTDKLLEETRRDRDYAEKNGFMDMYHERQALIDRIEAQPTAYDPDKVVEQLKAASYERYGNDGMGGELVVNLDDVVEIMKGGRANG